MKLLLTHGKITKFDDHHWEPVKGLHDGVGSHTWHAKQDRKTKIWYAYSSIKINGVYKEIALHRFLLGLMYSSKHQVDHENGDGLNNFDYNIRVGSRSQNIANSRIRIDNSSGYKGVIYDRWSSKWIARVSKNKVRIFLGRFSCPILAAKAYDHAAKKLFGRFAKVNFEEVV